MKIFNSEQTAIDNMGIKETVYINSLCPYTNKICGSWCALFYKEESDGLTSYIILGCSNSQPRIYINK
jgi:hypothetical protein